MGKKKTTVHIDGEDPTPVRDDLTIPKWIHDNGDADDMENNINRILFGSNDPLPSENGSVFDDSVDHSFADKTRAHSHPRGPFRKGGRGASAHQRQRGNGRHGVDEDEDDSDEFNMIDEKLAHEQKLENEFGFVGEELPFSRVMTGELLRTSDRHKQRLAEMATELPSDDVLNTMNDGANDVFNHYRNLMASEAEAVHEGVDINNCTREEVQHMECLLCKHTSIQSNNMNPEFFKAYDLLMRLDREKCGFAADSHIFQQMEFCFNAMQKNVRDNGGKNFFFVNVDIVRNHFLYHDTSNPLRPMIEQLNDLKQIRKMASKHLFGHAHGKKIWNSQKTKTWLHVVKQEQSVINNLALLRHQMNILAESAGNTGPAQSATKSRHLNTVQKGGRYFINK